MGRVRACLFIIFEICVVLLKTRITYLVSNFFLKKNTENTKNTKFKNNKSF